MRFCHSRLRGSDGIIQGSLKKRLAFAFFQPVT